MDNIVTALTSHKALLIIAVFISILIIFSFLKHIARIVIVIVAVLVLYAAYLVYTGQKVPKTKNETIEHVTNKIEQMTGGREHAPRGGK